MTYFSYISNITTRSPTTGIRNINNITEKYNIPVTWAVTARFSHIYKNLLNEFHENKNDTVIFQLESSDPILDNPGMEEYLTELDKIDDQTLYEKMLRDQTKKIKKALPWAKLDIATRIPNNIHYFRALKALGFKAIWGFCSGYQDRETIKYTGLPLGIYNLDLDYKVPGCNRMGEFSKHEIKRNDILALQLFTIDPNRAYYSNKPDIYSLNSLHSQKYGLISKDSIQYWKKIIQDYQSNEQNSFIPILQYQSANEFEHTMLNSGYRHPSEISELIDVYEKFFAYLTNQTDLEIVNLSDMIKAYETESYNEIAPQYLHIKDSNIDSKKYHEIIRSREFKRDMHVKRLWFLLKRIFGKAKNHNRTIKLPKNGSNFPSLFIYQDHCTQLIYETTDIESEFIRPNKQFMYNQKRITKWKRYPIIRDYTILDNQMAIEYNLEIKASTYMPWGILIPEKLKDIDVQYENADYSVTSTQKSCDIGNYAFIYLILDKGTNRIRVAATNREA